MQLPASLNIARPSLPTASFTPMAVVCQADFELAAANLQTAKTLRKEIEDQRVAMKKPIDEAAKAVQAFFKPYIDALDQYDASQKREMLGFQQTQERAAALARAAAERAAEEERARLQAEAEAALASGDVERAEKLASVAEVVQAPLQESAPKVSGISTRKVWKAEVTDKAAFVAAAASNPVFLAAIEIVEQTLAKLASATDGKMAIPGVRLYQDESMSARRAA